MLEDGLLRLDKVARILKTFLRPYDGSLLEVHPQNQLLEYFYKTQLSFAAAPFRMSRLPDTRILYGQEVYIVLCGMTETAKRLCGPRAKT